jgi:hypothetical protein
MLQCDSAITTEDDMTRLLQMGLLLSVATAAAAGAPPDVAQLSAPAGAKLVLQAHATGAQIYSCRAGTDGSFQWALKAPDADLHDKKGAVIGHHFAGPTWKHQDGSEVTGKASAHVDSPDADAIPWLLVAATGHTGEGVFARVTAIQRVHTKGGKPSAAAPCDASKDGTETRSTYSADYLFYAAAK